MSAEAGPTLPPLPKVGEVIEAKREPGDAVMYSVTHILDKAIAKQDQLIPWAVNETAEQTVTNLAEVVEELDRKGHAEAVKLVKGMRWRTGGKLWDKDLGSVAHKLFDQWATDPLGRRPEVHPELHPKYVSEKLTLVEADVWALNRMLDQFDSGWLQAHQPDYLCTEVVVYNPAYGHAGQADAFCSVQRVPVVCDYKTSRKTWDSKGKLRGPYPDHALQVAAYRWCTRAAVWRARRYESGRGRYYLLSEAERAATRPVPATEGGLIVKVTPEDCHVYPVACGRREHEVFLFCQEIARWSYAEAGHVVGNALTPSFAPPTDSSDPFAGLPDD